MPRVLKFSCHNCGAKLAVPLHMSGMSDQCPKCGTVVTSPALPPKEARASGGPPKDRSGGTYSAEQLAEALRPQPATPPASPVAADPRSGEKTSDSRPAKPPARARRPEPVSRSPLSGANDPPPQPSLFPTAQLASPAPAPEVRPGPVVSEAPPKAPFPDAPVVRTQPELFRPPPPSRAPEAPPQDQIVPRPSTSLESNAEGTRSPRARNIKARPQLHAVSRRPSSPEEDPVLVDPGAAPSALLPRSVPDVETASDAARLGVGEALAPSTPSGPLSLPTPEVRPRLNVPLVQVGSSPRRERRMRWNRMALLGVAAFLFVDLLVMLWVFRKPIGIWWKGPPKSSSVVSTTPLPPEEPEGGSPVETPSGPSNGPSDSAKTVDGPSIAAPSDFLDADSAPVRPTPPAEDPPVPMAIPVTDIPSDPSAALTSAPAPSVVSLPPPEATGSMAPPAPVLAGATSSGPAPESAPVETPAPTSSSPAATVIEGGLLPAAPLVASSATTAAETVVPVPPSVAVSPASTPPPSPPPLRENVPEGASIPVPYGGLPPPPADMAPPNGPGSFSSPAVTLVTTAPRIGKVPKEAQSALEILQKFLEAPTWKDRLPFVQKADSLKSAMERHAVKFGDGPIRVGKIDFVERYVNRNQVPPYCMFELSGGSLAQAVLILVEQSSKNGVKVDWEAFVDFKDNLLLRFLEDKHSSPQKFRVMIRRKHYFDKDVPDIASKDTFEVKQPQGHFQGAIFAAKSSSIGRQLANQLAWGMDMPVIAELAWRTDGKNHWVEIVSITSYGWRG